jgi:hypothetical protein
MAGHYYKDDISAEQMAMKTIDFCLDLAEFSTTEIQSAFTNYRQDPKRKKFPAPGDIRELCFQERADRRAATRAPVRALSRPLMWWHRPKTRWDIGWLESDVPSKNTGRCWWPFPVAAPIGV